MTYVRSNNISLKYQRLTTLGSKDIGIRKSEFVAKSQFLWENLKNLGYNIDLPNIMKVLKFLTVFLDIICMSIHGIINYKCPQD